MKWQPIVHPVAISIIAFILIAVIVRHLILQRKQHAAVVAWWRRLAIIVLLVIMAFGPSVTGGKSSAGMVNLDVLFVVDTTTSMGAEDYVDAAERLVGVRKDIISLSEKMAGARFGLITFDAEARIEMPMTTDRTTLVNVVEVMNREPSTYSQGSSIDKPIELIKTQIQKNKKKNPQRPNIVIYIGDGEQTAKQEPKSFTELKPLIDGGAVLGYGSSEGGKMKRYYGYSNSYADDSSIVGKYVEDYSAYNQNGDYSFPVGISKIDETALGKIASEVGMVYQNRNAGGDVSTIIDNGKIKKIADSTRQITSYRQLYYIGAIPLGLLLLWELSYINKQTDGIVFKRGKRT
jgi:Ca-activated chloride channel family protein